MVEDRPPYGAAALAGLGAFVLYVVTLAPTTAFWDTSEYIATAHILGIPHPPGNALFVFVARAWSLLLAPTGLDVAVRINLLAAATAAGAVAFFFLVAHRVMRGVWGGGRRAVVGGLTAALVGATVLTVWNQANVNEKVYTVSVLVIAAVSWLGILWRDRHGREGSERYLLAALFLMVLGSTNHLMSVLPAPALVLVVGLTRPGVVVRPAFLARAVPLVLLGLSFNFVLPVRAELDPVINEGDPTCERLGSAAVAIFSNGRAGCADLAYNLTRQQYQKPSILERQAPLGDQLLNYWQYFEWQWARGAEPSELPGGMRLPFALLFAGLGLGGLWAAWRADRVTFAYLGALAVTLTLGLVYYLNFKYGYSLAPEVTNRDLHEVRERDYFFVASFLLWGTLAGIGLAWVWGTAATMTRSPRGALLTSPVLAAALVPLLLNWPWASRAGDYAARDWAYDLLMSVEPYGIIFTNGDNDTFPLWYLQEVEGLRRDVTVIVGQYLHTRWYPKQLQELTAPARQRPFVADQAAGLYPEPAAAPAEPIIDVSPEQMDGVGGLRLRQDLTIPFQTLAVTYPSGMILNRDHQLALSIIHDSIGERPVYFSSRSGLMTELGLDIWGVRQGLVTKLVFRSTDGDLPAGLVRGGDDYGGEVFDLERSLTLYREVYQYRSILGRPIWQDRSTLNIPFVYYALALQLSDVAQRAELDEELVQRLEADALDFQVVAQGGVRGTPGA